MNLSEDSLRVDPQSLPPDRGDSRGIRREVLVDSMEALSM